MRSLVIRLLILLGLLFSGIASAATVVEFYNTTLDNYFITADSGEAAAIDGGAAGPGWSRTGNTFTSGGSTSVCRFYGSQSPGPNSHFFTVDPGECQGLIDQQIPTGNPRKLTDKSWNFESLDFVSTPATNGTCPGGTVPVYRAYNNGFTRGVDSNHRITTNLTAIQQQEACGWSNEGVVMCAPSGTTSGGMTSCGITPVLGQCGSSSGSSSTLAPTANLCTTGTASSINGTGPWTWTCRGSNGGANESCSASKVAATLSCTGAYGPGYNGIRFYNPANWFTYQFSNSSAKAVVTTTAGWGVSNSGLVYSYTGSLKAALRATSTSYSGGTLGGTIVGEFIPNFTGIGAYSPTQVLAGSYSTNTITSSAVAYNPPSGQYCIVLALLMYMPSNCSASDGYCIVDWLQFGETVTFY